MSKARLILLGAFVLVLCAGVVLGRLWTRIPLEVKGSTTQPSWLADQLDLRPDQREKMDAIWNETGPKLQKSFERRQELDRQRDQTIQELLTPAEWAAYDKIIEDWRTKRAGLDKERHQMIADANERSTALLDDGQKQKWEMLKNLREHQWHGPYNNRAATRPSATTTESNP